MRQEVFVALCVFAVVPWSVAFFGGISSFPRSISLARRLVERDGGSTFFSNGQLWASILSRTPDPDPVIEDERRWLRRRLHLCAGGVLGFVLVAAIAALEYSL